MGRVRFANSGTRRSYSDSDVGCVKDRIFFIQVQKIHGDFVRNVESLFKKDILVAKMDPEELKGMLAMEAESFCGDFNDHDGSQDHSMLKQAMERFEQFMKYFEKYKQEMGVVLEGSEITFEQVNKNLTKKKPCVSVGFN